MAKLLVLERRSSAHRNKGRLDALQTVIHRAVTEVPMYQDLYGEVILSDVETLEDLQHLPTVSKELLKANFPDRISSSKFDARDLYQIATSGTSDRVMLFQDESKRDWDRAADLLTKIRTGMLGKVLMIPPDDCYERCGISDKTASPVSVLFRDAIKNVDPSERVQARRKLINRIAQHFLWRESVMPAPGVDGTAVEDAVIDHYFNEISHLAPTTIKALPYYYWILAKRNRGRKLTSVSTARPSGGKASPLMIQEIESQLDVIFRENYGTAELGTISIDGTDRRAQSLFEHLFIIEFVRRGKPVQPGEYGEMLITDLRNHAAPLIRYAVGDVGRVTYQPKPNDTRQLEFEVAGRIDECIVTEAGKLITPDQLMDFFIAWPGIEFSRLIQKSDDRFLLEVVPGEVDIDQPEIEQAFADLTGQPVQLQTRKVRRIPPEGSGKYKLIQSTSFQNFHHVSAMDEPSQATTG